MKTRNLSAISAAFAEVRKHCPQVSIVTYDIYTRHRFQDQHGEPAIFPPGVDVGILEDAADSVESVPAAFMLTAAGIVQLSFAENTETDPVTLAMSRQLDAAIAAGAAIQAANQK